mmetsp:Transcript_22905/g.36961  ORF Transcript_22905/g.36961 Transcript_22905/m.36961 type:complete len:92 (+) Transcript_22905:1373-1648(+)
MVVPQFVFNPHRHTVKVNSQESRLKPSVNIVESVSRPHKLQNFRNGRVNIESGVNRGRFGGGLLNGLRNSFCILGRVRAACDEREDEIGDQ